MTQTGVAVPEVFPGGAFSNSIDDFFLSNVVAIYTTDRLKTLQCAESSQALCDMAC